MAERAGTAYQVDASDEAAQPFEDLAIVQFRRAPAAARVHREREAVGVEQGLAAQLEGRHHGHLGLEQLAREPVLLEDLRVAPAAGAIELGDHQPGTLVGLDADLVHAVLVAVEREEAAVAAQAGGVDRIEDHVRGEARVRVEVAHAPF